VSVIEVPSSEGLALICLDQIQLLTTIGWNEWERKKPKILCLDIAFVCDIQQAGHSDHLSDTVDYAALTEAAQSFVEQSEFRLLESLIDALANHILEKFSVVWLRLKIIKPGVLPGVKQVSLQIERFHPQLDGKLSKGQLPL